jgi:hypothetical protein
MQSERSTIYIELLDEGTECWRPVSAERLSEATYCIVDSVPEGESWLFKPGDVVRCKTRSFSNSIGLAAFELVSLD